MKKLTIITPCFNEEHNVVICAEAVRKVMNNQLKDFDYEHIFADNASTDSTAKKLRVMASEDPKIKIIINRRKLQFVLVLLNIDGQRGLTENLDFASLT